jgi:HK97 family phage portal protein
MPFLPDPLPETRQAAIVPREGEYRDGPWYLPITGGWLPHEVGQYWNWWQLGYDVQTPAPNAMVEACINAYANRVAMCPGDQWRAKGNGGRVRVDTVAAYRLFRAPNTYQSASDFLYNAVRSLWLTGNAYALALRNDRFEVAELHLMQSRASGVRLAPTGDVFYYLAGNEIVEARIGPNALAAVPARDVLHIRLNTPHHPLIGESPLLSALPDIAAAGAMTQQQLRFYMNQARPSFVLSTDQGLTKDQTAVLREAWNEQSRGMATGGTPILSWGLKPHPISTDQAEGAWSDQMKGADGHVALALGVPLQVLGLGTTTTPTETVVNGWLSGGLGFILDNVERAFDRLFRLPGWPAEYIELDTAALLRVNERERVETAAAAIKGGVDTINEVRTDRERPRVTGGDDIRVQQQDVPLDWHEQQKQRQQRPPEPPPEPDADEGSDDAERSPTDWARAIIDAADTFDRRAA